MLDNVEILKKYNYDLKNVPYNEISEHIINIFIKKNGLNIGFVSEEYITYDLYKTAVKQNGLALGYVQKVYITCELCLIAVKQNGLALKYVPEDYLTHYLCILAVKQNGLALKYISEKYVSSEYISKKYITYDTCKAAVQQNGLALEYIPNEHISSDICKTAIQQNKLTIQIIKQLIKQNEFINEELSLFFIKNGLPLMHIPEKYITEEICRIAYINDIENLKFIPYKYKYIFEPIPINKKTDYDCLITMSQIENGYKYYICSNRSDHIFDKEAFDIWLKINGKTNCTYCMKPIDISKIYIN